MNTPRRIVLTRTRRRCKEWSDRLESMGVSTLVLPVIRHEPLPAPAALSPSEFDWILFTSPQGVCAFFDRFPPSRLHGRLPRLGALGRGTARELAVLGLEDALDARARNGIEFARCFTEKVGPPASVLLPGAARRMGEYIRILEAAGFETRELPLYRTIPVPPEELPPASFMEGDFVFFTSPSAVRAFRAAFEDISLPCACLGMAATRAALEAGFDPKAADRPDLESLCRAAGLEWKHDAN